MATLGLWGPRARSVLGGLVDPNIISEDTFPFATAKRLPLMLPDGSRVDVWAARISYVGELGWELYLDNDPAIALPLYDALLDDSVVPVGIETYASSRRLEMCFRLQGADLETEWNAYESGVARAKVKSADFIGKDAYLAGREQQPVAHLCAMTLDTLSVDGAAPRYPVGAWPILDPANKEVLVDSKGRRSYSTSTSYCPSLGEHVVMAYLPVERARAGEKLILEYFNEGGDGHYPMTVRIVGRGSLYKPRSGARIG